MGKAFRNPGRYKGTWRYSLILADAGTGEVVWSAEAIDVIPRNVAERLKAELNDRGNK